MLVLHALFASDKTLFIWGENPARWKKPAGGCRISRVKSTLPPHPSAGRESLLREEVSAICPGDDPVQFSDASISLQIPSARGVPRLSPPSCRG